MTVSEELDTIHSGAGIFPLTDRAFLRSTGPDATRWLNGMVTNSIQSLQPGEGNYNFLLNAQGRIMGDCMIYREPAPSAEPMFLLETDSSQIENIHQLLDKFIIMDDVELSRGVHIQGTQPETLPLGIAIIGAQASHHLLRVIEERAGDDPYVVPHPGTMTYGSLEGNKVIVLSQLVAGMTTFEVWCSSRGEYEELYRKLEFEDMLHLSPEAFEAHRILSGTPRYGQDIRNSEMAKDLPQETAQTHALHFAKGCYLGQEIVERIRSRGQVHRTFTRFTLTGEMPALPAKLTSDDKPAGDLTSAVRIGDNLHALGYIRRELLETRAPITYPGGIATPSTSK